VSIKDIKEYLYNRDEVVFAYLYGSMAQGKENKLSDIDIAVYIDESKKPDSGTFGYRSELITEVQSLVKREVDLVILSEVSLLLAVNILKNGKLLFTKSEKLRIKFHKNIMRKYLDFIPNYNLQEKYLKKDLEEGRYGR